MKKFALFFIYFLIYIIITNKKKKKKLVNDFVSKIDSTHNYIDDVELIHQKIKSQSSSQLERSSISFLDKKIDISITHKNLVKQELIPIGHDEEGLEIFTDPNMPDYVIDREPKGFFSRPTIGYGIDLESDTDNLATKALNRDILFRDIHKKPLKNPVRDRNRVFDEDEKKRLQQKLDDTNDELEISGHGRIAVLQGTHIYTPATRRRADPKPYITPYDYLPDIRIKEGLTFEEQFDINNEAATIREQEISLTLMDKLKGTEFKPVSYNTMNIEFSDVADEHIDETKRDRDFETRIVERVVKDSINLYPSFYREPETNKWTGKPKEWGIAKIKVYTFDEPDRGIRHTGKGDPNDIFDTPDGAHMMGLNWQNIDRVLEGVPPVMINELMWKMMVKEYKKERKKKKNSKYKRSRLGKRWDSLVLAWYKKVPNFAIERVISDSQDNTVAEYFEKYTRLWRGVLEKMFATFTEEEKLKLISEAEKTLEDEPIDKNGGFFAGSYLTLNKILLGDETVEKIIREMVIRLKEEQAEYLVDINMAQFTQNRLVGAICSATAVFLYFYISDALNIFKLPKKPMDGYYFHYENIHQW